MLSAPPRTTVKAGPPLPPTETIHGQPPLSSAASPNSDAAATAALLLLTLASGVGLMRVFTGHGWLGPVVLTAVGVHAAAWATRRARLPQGVALVLTLVALWVLAAWTVLGSTTYYGFPGAGTASHLGVALGQAHADFVTAVTPAVVTTGFELLAVLGIGCAALLGDWAAFRWRSALYGAAPAFAFFVVCCAIGQGPGRLPAVTLEVAGLLVFLVVHRATVGRADQTWFGNQRSGAAGWAIRAGCLAAAASLLAAVALTPAVSRSEGRGLLGWRGGLGNSGSGARQVPNPIVDLHTRLLTENSTPVFKVHSTAPSYWRLTSLDAFTGQDWVSTNSYRSFAGRLPGALAVPPGTRVVQQQFQVQQLGSVWLPDAFTPVAVSGVHHVSYDATSGSLITSHPTSNGLTYSVESYQFLSALDPAQLKAAGPVAATGSLARYVQLPNTVPTSVYNLAKSITANETTEYGKALALQNFFLGPSFTYDLTPPTDGYGISALTTFLFQTRTGYCQQFAGAYAVLARAIGLPTRLAVGFATGKSDGHSNYAVTDADAHTWPEVYFGPRFGWLPFEPTKSYVNPTSEGYAPSTASGGSSGFAAPVSPFDAIPKGLPEGLGAAAGAGSRAAAGAANQGAAPVVRHHGADVRRVLLLLLAGVMVWAVVVALVRRSRWAFRRWRARGDTAALVRSRWADVSERLGWWGALRQASETDDEFAARAAVLLAQRLREPSPWLPGGVRRLAGLATEAVYAPALPAGRASEAAAVAREIHRGLFRAATGRQLLSWALDPRPGWRSASRAERVSAGDTGRAAAAWPGFAR
jgi:transglutaminase-like putative cysteine protease